MTRYQVELDGRVWRGEAADVRDAHERAGAALGVVWQAARVVRVWIEEVL